jgi:hypothetical protein
LYDFVNDPGCFREIFVWHEFWAFAAETAVSRIQVKFKMIKNKKSKYWI